MEKDLTPPEPERLHTTPMGAARIARNLGLDPATDADAAAEYCKKLVRAPDCRTERRGKNWYCEAGGVRLTIHARSHTVITAHPSPRGGRKEEMA